MKSLKNGKSTSRIEVTNISQHGFWILLGGKEYFLPFEKYPWFKNATIASISNVKLSHNYHLYWPDLDVDLSVKILSDPGNYPLTYH